MRPLADMDVNNIINEIIRREGGYVNHPADKGGPTNMGITLRTLENDLGREVTIDELKALTKNKASEIYLKSYYTQPKIDKLPEEVQPIALDTSVLYGPKRAIIFLQMVVNLAGFGPITEDGVLGPMTKDKVTEAYMKMGKYFINAIVEERINFCNRIVEANPSQKVFLKGWINRANKFVLA